MRISYDSGKYVTAVGATLLLFAALGDSSTTTKGLVFLFGGTLFIAGLLLWAIGNARKK